MQAEKNRVLTPYLPRRAPQGIKQAVQQAVHYTPRVLLKEYNSLIDMLDADMSTTRASLERMG